MGRLNPLFAHLPVENMIYSNQEAYYDAIAVSSAKGDSEPFIDFMLGELLNSNPSLTAQDLADNIGITKRADR